MAVAFITQRRRRQPTGPQRIDWTNQLADDLIACWLPTTGIFLRDIVSGTLGVNTGTIVPAYAGNRTFGPMQGLDFSAAGSYVSFTGGAAGVPYAGGKALSVVALVRPNVTTRGDMVTCWGVSFASQQFTLLEGLTGGRPQFYVSNGSSANFNSGINVLSSPTMDIGGTYLAGGSADVNGVDVYLDGRFEASSTTDATSPNATPSQNYRIAENIDLNGHFAGSFFFGAVWKARKTQQFWCELYANPWQLFVPLIRRSYFLPTVVGLPTRSLNVNQAVHRSYNY